LAAGAPALAAVAGSLADAGSPSGRALAEAGCPAGPALAEARSPSPADSAG
jgi:hypothetical protein